MRTPRHLPPALLPALLAAVLLPSLAATVLSTATPAAAVATHPADLAADPAPGASTGPGAGTVTLRQVQVRSANEIARRQAALAARLTLVTTGSPALTGPDRAGLETLIRNDQSGLAALGGRIASDTDLGTAQADQRQIFTGYRVYALVLPQIRLVRADDALITQALPQLTDARSRLAAELARSGRTEQAAATMADLDRQVQTIRDDTSGLSAKVLALTPAQWNADHGVLAPARQSLLSARAALARARADIATVRALLA